VRNLSLLAVNVSDVCKCMPILQYAIEACPLLARQTLSFEFILTRIFMKIFRTGSPKVVNECQVSFGFLPAKSQILILMLAFCRGLLCLKIARACCLRMMRSGSCMVFLYYLVTMFGRRASCAVLFLLSSLMGHSYCWLIMIMFAALCVAVSSIFDVCVILRLRCAWLVCI